MARTKNQKLKLLYLAKIISEKTDEEHGLTVNELISNLKEYDIKSARKTMYEDIDLLCQFGFDIKKYQEGRDVRYHLVSRDFETSELKLLVDYVQSCKFLTEHKSLELIAKLETLTSVHKAKQLHRQVILTGRVKAINEKIYYNVDRIHDAIDLDQQVQFQYFKWNVKKEPELRHGGIQYQISPWALQWDNSNYYLVGFDEKDGIIKHFRVDKMLHLEICNEKRKGKDSFANGDVLSYSKRLFGMFGGKSETVTLLCRNDLVGPIIDRFGQDIILIPADEDHFKVKVDVFMSTQYLGWIIALGEGVKIIAPESAVNEMKKNVRRLIAQYSV